jgi:hypothetical protein
LEDKAMVQEDATALLRRNIARVDNKVHDMQAAEEERMARAKTELNDVLLPKPKIELDVRL